jgi:hypothetical protein
MRLSPFLQLSLPVQRGSSCHTLFHVSPLHFSLAEKEFFISNFLGARSFAISGARHALVALLIALCSLQNGSPSHNFSFLLSQSQA